MNQEAELKYLQRVDSLIESRIEKMEHSQSETRAEILESKRELWQNFYELDPEEVAASTVMIEGDVIRHDDNEKQLRTLYRQKHSPYFGRIDFCEDGYTDTFYIGIASLNDESSLADNLVYDWRAPVSSMYYNFETGPASFQAPVGLIEGDITAKYQYKILDGKLLYMFDSSITIQDEILQMELGGNASDRMKNIISTIQKEQNQIIRAERNQTLIVQGAAGSGKTSIALHRVAYLLYQYKDTMKSSNILIISPSRMFSTYISGVLPELGEDGIIEMSLADLAEKELGAKTKRESRFNYIETCLSGKCSAKRIKQLDFKASSEFLNLMESYIEKRATEIFVPESIQIGPVEVDETELLCLYQEHFVRLAPYQRIQQIREFVHERVADYVGDRGVRKEIRQQLDETLDSFQNYSSLQDEYNLFLEYLNREGYPSGTAVAGKVPYEDVYPLVLFKMKLFGKPNYKFIKHLLIDEMQDYTPVQYEILNMVFDCPKTILGDIEQTVDPYTNIGSLDVLRNIYSGKCVFLEMNKSYRSSYEITEVAKSILGSASYESVDRHGDKPRFIRCDSLEKQAAAIKDRIDKLTANYDSIAVMCKTSAEAKALWTAIDSESDVRLLTDPDEVYNSGVIVTTCFIAKGLEFDCVLVPNCDHSNYHKPIDRKPLYVAATRALHQLDFYCVADKPSDFLQNAIDSSMIDQL